MGLPICKDDPGLDVGLPDFVHNLCALFPQVCDGEDVPPGSDSLPGNFSLPDVCGALPDLFFCRDDEIPEDWESVGDQICGELPNHPFCGGDGVSSLTDLICASVPDLCFDGLTLPNSRGWTAPCLVRRRRRSARRSRRAARSPPFAFSGGRVSGASPCP